MRLGRESCCHTTHQKRKTARARRSLRCARSQKLASATNRSPDPSEGCGASEHLAATGRRGRAALASAKSHRRHGRPGWRTLGSAGMNDRPQDRGSRDGLRLPRYAPPRRQMSAPGVSQRIDERCDSHARGAFRPSERMTGKRNVHGLAPRALSRPSPSSGGDERHNQPMGLSFDFNEAALT